MTMMMKTKHSCCTNRALLLLLLLLLAVSAASAVTTRGTNATSTTTTKALSNDDEHDGSDDDDKKKEEEKIPFQSTRVSVHIPHELHERNGDIHAAADFGFVHAEGSMMDYVYVIENGYLCEPVVNKTELAGHPASAWPPTGPHNTFFLMVNRPEGHCSFVLQARHAQHMGASALIVADDRPCTTAEGSERCLDFPRMVSDGSAGDVSIPVFMLNQNKSQHILDVTKNKNQPVLMELAWGLKRTYYDDETPEEENQADSTPALYYHLWMTAHDPILDMETLYNLRTVATAMQPYATFAPRYHLLNGERFGCIKDSGTKEACGNLCTNEGRYCALHARDLSGHAIVRETLRQICIWDTYGIHASDSHEKHASSSHAQQLEAWWDYVLYHMEHCHAANHYADPDCIRDAMKHANIDHDKIDSCMTLSGDLEKDDVNTMLESALSNHSQSGVVTVPALTLNHKKLDHASSYTLFEAMCWHFYSSNAVEIPKPCEQCLACPNKIGCLEHGGKCVAWSDKERYHYPSSGSSDGGKNKSGKKGGGRRFGWTLFWILFFAMLGGAAYYYYKIRMENENGMGGGLGDQGSGLLNNYLQLGSQE